MHSRSFRLCQQLLPSLVLWGSSIGITISHALHCPVLMYGHCKPYPAFLNRSDSSSHAVLLHLTLLPLIWHLFFYILFYLFIWPHWVWVAACRIFSCGMWDLVPWQEIEPGCPALEAWTTREVWHLFSWHLFSNYVVRSLRIWIWDIFTFVSPVPPSVAPVLTLNYRLPWHIAAPWLHMVQSFGVAREDSVSPRE